MGNAINSRLFSARAETEWQPNIGADNNLNRPHSVQLQDMVLHYAVPVFFMVALAVRESQQRAREETLTQQHELTLQQLVAMSQDERQQLLELSRGGGTKQNAERQNLSDKITALEQEEEKKHQQQLQRLKVYDSGLQRILDIRCSLFKDKSIREQIEADLDERLHLKDGDLATLVYPGLRNVVKHDYKFCGTSKETNGKLRQLYANNWRLQLELNKHKTLLNKIKQATKANS